MTARGSAAFALFLEKVVEVVADVAVAVKPNTAFFERFGAAGWEVLQQVARQARKAGLIVVADAKRGDIGHTAEAYADSLLGELPDTLGPYVDAVTVNPYLGTDAIEPFLARARLAGKGVFVLVRTTNPSAGEVQDLETGGRPVYLRVAELVEAGPCGRAPDFGGPEVVGIRDLAVVGATAPEQARRLRGLFPRTLFLVPGFGAQGAEVEGVRASFLPGGKGAVINASRSILYAHEKRGGAWVDAIRAAAIEARDELEKLRGSV